MTSYRKIAVAEGWTVTASTFLIGQVLRNVLTDSNVNLAVMKGYRCEKTFLRKGSKAMTDDQCSFQRHYAFLEVKSEDR